MKKYPCGCDVTLLRDFVGEYEITCGVIIALCKQNLCPVSSILTNLPFYISDANTNGYRLNTREWLAKIGL